MSIFSDLRGTATDLFAVFGTSATLTTRGAPTRDKIAGSVTPGATSSKPVLAALGKRRVVADDGTVRIQSTAKLNANAVDGDVLSIGALNFRILTVEEVNPDGGVPMLWLATLKGAGATSDDDSFDISWVAA